MIPIGAIQPWMIKLGVCLLIFGCSFAGGCRLQARIDAKKVERQKNIARVAMENAAVREQAIKEHNEYVEKLGKIHEARVSSLKTAHEKALAEFIRNGRRDQQLISRETAELRKRLAELSVAEACHEAWKELARATRRAED